MAITRVQKNNFGVNFRSPIVDLLGILIPTLILLCLGLLMVLSSSSLYAISLNEGPYSIALKQVIFLIAGIPLMVCLTLFNSIKMRNLAWVLFPTCIILLLAVFTPLGYGVKGNRSWLKIGGKALTIQPSEFSKFAMVLFVAAVLGGPSRDLRRVSHLVPAVVAFICVTGLVISEHDLGTSIVFVAIFFSLIWVAGVNWKILAALASVACLIVISLVITSPNRMLRILSLAGNNSDPDASRQPLASVQAIASGGILGRGIGSSREKWGALADGAQNDFIVAVIGEELGLVGILFVMALLASIVFFGFRCAFRADNLFDRYIATGCSAWIAFQSLINIGMAMKLLPVIGVPLPLVSQGGSALVASMMACGGLLYCARRILINYKVSLKTRE